TAHLPAPLLQVMFSERTGDDRLHQTLYTQPALFALEYALYQLWRSWGVEAAAALGHSVGEYVAACVAGVFSLEDGLKLVAARGRLMQALPSGGAMSAVLAGPHQVAEVLADWEGQVSLAALNGPSNTVISGPQRAVERALEALAKTGVKSSRLAVSHAFHTALMDPMLDEFEKVARTVTYCQPQKALISNVTGRLVENGQVSRAAYWREHAREAVRFAEGIETLVRQGHRTFIEAGPQPVLSGMGKQCVLGEGLHWIGTLRRGQDDWEELLQGVGKLYVHGAAIDWRAFDQDYARRRLRLPTYPFQRKRHWIEAPSPAEQRVAQELPGRQQTAHPLLGRRLLSPRLTAVVYEAVLGAESPAYLADHRIAGEILLPIAAFAEMAAAAALQACGEPRSIEDLVVLEPLIFAGERPVTAQIVIERDTFQIFSLGGETWKLHASGRVAAPGEPSPALLLATVRAKPAEAVAADHYTRLARHGADFGPVFRSIERLWTGAGEALAFVRLDSELDPAGYG